MKITHFSLKYLYPILIYNLIFTTISYAQITVDKKNILNPSIVKVNKNKKLFNISGGTKRGNNLFHSFTEFNSRKGETINLSNKSKIQNIIIRVNGQNKSILEGKINSAIKTNLLILNPQGIKLGDMFSTMNLNKFHVSTANSISFSDGFVLDKFKFIDKSNLASTLQSLNFRPDSGKIDVTGNGIRLPFVFSLFPINTLTQDPNGNFEGAKLITLSGTDITFDGAVLKIKDANLEIFSVNNGDLVDRGSNFIVEGTNLGNIELTNNSLVLAFGSNSKVNTMSNKLDINASSLLLLDNIQGSQGGISIVADDISLEGAKLKSKFDFSSSLQSASSDANRSGIFVLNQSDSEVANIDINADSVDILSGATIINQGGDIGIEATDIIVDSRFDDFNTLDSSIQVIPSLAKDAGDLTISSKNLDILNGGIIGSPAGSLRNAGRSFINSENILIKGYNRVTEFPSSIGSVSVTGNNSNDIEVNATNLSIQDGATITSFSSGGGNTGTVIINASNISIIGFSDNSLPDTGISSFVFPQFSQPSGIDVAQDLLKIPVSIDGISGNLIITSDTLKIYNGSINVSNFGGRDAGNFMINARVLDIINSRISAATAGGNGGSLDIRGGLVLLRDSLITTNAIQFGEGGGISINTDAFLTAGANEVAANAQFNIGGRVKLNSEIIAFSEDTVLTSNSQLGEVFNGEISITQRENELRLIESRPKVDDPPMAIKSSCETNSNNILVNNHGLGTDAVALSEKQQALQLKEHMDYTNQFYYIDSDTGKKMPYKPLLAVEEKENGNIELIFTPEQSQTLQNLLSSLDNNCSMNS